MKIRKYLAKDIQEAIRLIKSDLGSDAVIISSRKVYGRGFTGFFRRQLEVTAALDEYGLAPKGASSANNTGHINGGNNTGGVGSAGCANNAYSINVADNHNSADLHQEIADIKRILSRVVQMPPARSHAIPGRDIGVPRPPRGTSLRSTTPPGGSLPGCRPPGRTPHRGETLVYRLPWGTPFSTNGGID